LPFAKVAARSELGLLPRSTSDRVLASDEAGGCLPPHSEVWGNGGISAEHARESGDEEERCFVETENPHSVKGF
jgi:hypothetical protein